MTPKVSVVQGSVHEVITCPECQDDSEGQQP